MALTAAVKLLSAGGLSHQIAIVPVRIKRMTFKVRFNRFNARVCMLTQFKPVICHTALLFYQHCRITLVMSGRFVHFHGETTDCRKLKQLNSFSRNNVDDRA
jgi:hypothetical protein